MKAAAGSSPKEKIKEVKTRWPHPLLLIAVIVGSFFMSQFIVGLVFGLILMALGDIDQIQSIVENSVATEFALLGCALLLELMIIWKFMKLWGMTLEQIKMVRPKKTDALWALLAYVAYFPVTLIVQYVAERLIPAVDLDQMQNIGFKTADNPLELLAVFVSLVLITATFEEFITRGVLYHGLKARIRLLPAAIITSVLFAAAHLELIAGKGSLLWAAAIDTFILSMVLIMLVEKTKSLWPGIFLHIVKNGLAFVYLFIYMR